MQGSPDEALPATLELIGGYMHIAHRCTVRSRCLLQQRSPSVRLWQQQAVVLVANAQHLATVNAEHKCERERAAVIELRRRL